MGRPKMMLPFGAETMLARVVRLLREVVDPVVVVAAHDGSTPELPPDVLVVHDREEDRGPLEGLVVGLQAIDGRAEAAYVTGCDAPLLQPRFVQGMIDHLAGYDAVVPHIDGFDHPLTAVYHTNVLPPAEALLAESLSAGDRRRPALLFERVRTRRVSEEELRRIDPRLHSLTNVNGPDDYRAALAEAGFAVDDAT